MFWLLLLSLLVFGSFSYHVNTPTCVNEDNGLISDIAFVAYPDGSTTNCFSVMNRIKSNTIWFGFDYGVCTQAVPCGLACDVLDQCASQGFTMDGYNSCYQNQTGICETTNMTYAVVTPYDDYHIQEITYRDSECTQLTGATNASSTTLYDLDICFSGFDNCGYTTYAWIRLNKCPPVTNSSSSSTSTTSTGAPPDKDAASSLTNIFSFML